MCASQTVLHCYTYIVYVRKIRPYLKCIEGGEEEEEGEVYEVLGNTAMLMFVLSISPCLSEWCESAAVHCSPVPA